MTLHALMIIEVVVVCNYDEFVRYLPCCRYRKVSRPTFDEGERQDMTRELVELRSALSDINVFLHAERQQVSRLHAENERLQVNINCHHISSSCSCFSCFCPSSYY